MIARDPDPTETARVPAPPMIARDPDPKVIDGTGSTRDSFGSGSDGDE